MPTLSDDETLFGGIDPAHRVRTDRLDVYTSPSADGPRPAIVLVHGGPVAPDAQPRDWPGAVGYATLAAASALTGIVIEHRLHSGEHYPVAADDLVAAVEETRALEAVDPDRVGLWFFSGGGPLAVDWMRDTPPWLRCLVWTYPVLAPPPDWDGDVPRFDAIAALGACRDLPKLLMRVEHEIRTARPEPGRLRGRGSGAGRVARGRRRPRRGPRLRGSCRRDGAVPSRGPPGHELGGERVGMTPSYAGANSSTRRENPSAP